VRGIGTKAEQMKGNEMMELKGIGNKLLNIFVVKVDPDNPHTPKGQNPLFIPDEEFIELWSKRLNGIKAIFKFWIIIASIVALGPTISDVQRYFQVEKILGHPFSSIDITFRAIKSYMSYFLVTPILNIWFCECRYRYLKKELQSTNNQ